MYDDIIAALRNHYLEANRKRRIAISALRTFPISYETYNAIKTKLDATNIAIRAVDKDEDINKILKKRREFYLIFLRIDRDIDSILRMITINSKGQFVVATEIIDTFLSLSRNVAQLRGLVNNLDIENLFNKIEHAEIQINRNINTNNISSRYVVPDGD